MTDRTSPDAERVSDVPEWQHTIIELVRSDPNLRITTLAHRLTPDFLKRAYKRLRCQAAPGPDGVTVEEYGASLEANITRLHASLRDASYRASPARRVHIPKPNGALRPLGIPNVEDRLVQTAILMLLEPIYEQDFLNFSYGFRPGRSAREALEALRVTIDRRAVKVVFEADIRGFFDHLDHEWLRKFLRHRIADRRVHRLIGKVLKSGVVEEGKVTRSKKGTPQGGPLSPLLANIYLHYVLDLWFDRRFSRSCRGVAEMVRYADDFVVCFEHLDEAQRFATEVAERFGAFGLELVPEKTRLIEFGKDSEPKGPGPKSGPTTFDFLGCTHYMRRRGKRGLRTARKPSKRSRTRFLAEVKRWLNARIHWPVRVHQHMLSRKLQGYFNYFGLRHCLAALRHVRWHTQRLWIQALRRRSQKASRTLSWENVRSKPWFSLPKPRLRRKKKPRKRLTKQLSLFPLMGEPA